MLSFAVCCVPKKKNHEEISQRKTSQKGPNNYKIEINGFSETKYLNFVFLFWRFQIFDWKQFVLC